VVATRIHHYDVRDDRWSQRLNALVFTKVGTNPSSKSTQCRSPAAGVEGSHLSSNGAQTVRIEVTDLARHTCTDSQNITINAMGCGISFTAPPTNLHF